MSTALTTKEKQIELYKEFNAQRNFFDKTLPQNCSYEKFIGIIATALARNPSLLDFDRTSLINACRDAAQDGLLLNNKEAALISYKGSIRYSPMIYGILKSIRNSGELLSINAHIVYENDEFSYTLGDDEHITHKPAITNQGEPILVYAIAKTKDGGAQREIMNIEQINAVRAKSPSANGAWKDFWGEMARKVCLRRLSKRLPMSSTAERVIQRDDDLYDFSRRMDSLEAPKPSIALLNQQIKDNILQVQSEAQG